MAIAKDMQNLANDIIAGYNLRMKAMGALVADTQRMLKGFAIDRRRMSADQAASLAQFVWDLSKNVRDTLKSARSTIEQMGKDHALMAEELRSKLGVDAKKLRSGVKSMRKENADWHSQMSDNLRKSLSGYVRDIVSDAASLVGEYRADSAKASHAWKSMSSALADARACGALPKVEAGEKTGTVEAAVKAGQRKAAKKKK